MIVLADHGALEALPLLVPMLVLTVVVLAATLRDRRRGRDG